jgi:hypothetical protein
MVISFRARISNAFSGFSDAVSEISGVGTVLSIMRSLETLLAEGNLPPKILDTLLGGRRELDERLLRR